MVYLSTGNAAPDLDGSQRAGMNLFAASVVAVDLNTGQYRWHFQEVHHDIWDYDGPQPPHLFTFEKDGQQIPAIGHANKNGFYFILDRRTGQPLYNVNEVPVPTDPAWQAPWPTQPQPATEPLIPQEVSTPSPYKAVPLWTPPVEEPHVIQPGAEAGPEWAPAAYSPRTRYTYIPAGGYEPWVYHSIPNVPNTLGSLISDAPSYVDSAHYGLFDAVDTTTGKIAWQMKVPQRVASGAVVAGDLVFFGESDGHFHALDARDGTRLWTYYDPNQPGIGGSNGSPAVYVANGREYVVTGFGGNTQVRSGQISPAGDALVAFALPQPGTTSVNVVTANPRQVPTGEIPPEGLQPIGHSAPAGARVVDITAKELQFSLSSLNVRPGEKIAIHLANQESVALPHNIAFGLPSGRTGMGGVLDAGQDGYFVFTAPQQPGAYQFWCDVEAHRQLGMMGTLVVQATSGGGAGLPNTGVEAGPVQTFAETGFSLSGQFLGYWRNNGGLPVFGYPIDSERQAEGRVEQWLERERFELHPENSGTPYQVELGRLGAEALAKQGRDWSTFAKSDPQVAHYVAETGHAIAPQFWDYWRNHGLEFGDPGISYRESLALFGYPLSEPQIEQAADGQMYLTQWFERARFEYHPSNTAPYQILLGRLGAEVLGQ
jgi:outer membrane protein assembly factor BamB/plastocyanin